MRRKLLKAEWAISNVGGQNMPRLVDIGLTDLPKSVNYYLHPRASSYYLYCTPIFFHLPTSDTDYVTPD